MRLLIVVPEQDLATGNWATARRLKQGLKNLGHSVRLQGTSLHPEALQQLREDAAFDLALLLHAYRSGRPWLEADLRTPYLVLVTGTDLSEGMDDPDQGPVIADVLRKSKAVLLQNPLLAEEFRRRERDFADKMHLLSPGVELGGEPFELRRTLGVDGDLPLLICPAGLRPIKNQQDLLRLFAALAPDAPDFRLVFCGPVLEEQYAREFLKNLEAHPWACWLGVIPPASMAAALRQADVVVNHSLSEGLPNTLAEAAALGRPILARAIPGNAAVVEHGRNGLLYRDPEEFFRCASRLLADQDLRALLSRPQPERYASEREARSLERICRGVLAS